MRRLRLLLLPRRKSILPAFLSFSSFFPTRISNAQITIPTGSYIIDMGVNTAVKPAGLRPYGMVHELVKFYKVPVIWVIRQCKTKDAVDYTINGFSYKGC